MRLEGMSRAFRLFLRPQPSSARMLGMTDRGLDSRFRGNDGHP